MLAAPLPDRLVGGLREAEVDGAREELLASVDAARGEQFLRAQHAQGRALFRSEQVLAALAPSQAEIRGPHVAALGEVGQQLASFVIGMRRDQKHGAELVQPVQGLIDLPGWGRLRIDASGP